MEHFCAGQRSLHVNDRAAQSGTVMWEEHAADILRCLNAMMQAERGRWKSRDTLSEGAQASDR